MNRGSTIAEETRFRSSFSFLLLMATVVSQSHVRARVLRLVSRSFYRFLVARVSFSFYFLVALVLCPVYCFSGTLRLPSQTGQQSRIFFFGGRSHWRLCVQHAAHALATPEYPPP